MKAEFASILKQLAKEFGPDMITLAMDAVSEHVQENRRDRKPSPEPEWIVEEDQDVADEDLGAYEPDFSEDTDYEDEDAFADKVFTDIENLAAMVPITTPQMVVATVRDLVLMAGEVRKFEEAQITKRLGIAAERDKAIAQIEAKTALLQDYLNKSFDERRENFQRLFGAVDEALATNNMQALALSLESVIRLADSSPFKDLRTVEETASALLDEDHEWDF